MSSYLSLALHIGGRWWPQASGGSLPVHNPADGTLLGHLPLAGAAELAEAAETAERGFAAWRRVSALERCRTLLRGAAFMRERAPALASVLTLEQGKPLAEATREVLLSADILAFQAEEATRLYGRTVPPRLPELLQQQVQRQPVGPVAAFTAWNFPVNLPTRKLASALAAGCSVILKPDEHTPASAMGLVQCLLDGGVPADALQMVCGIPSEVSGTLIAHPAMAKASFTGSVAVGRQLGMLCAQHDKRFTAELGGHAPVIVCDDANMDAVLKAAVPAKFRNAGQVCASPIRFYVQRALFDDFLARFATAAAALRLGPGQHATTHMGPLVHARRVADMAHFVADALDHGARCVTGGTRPDRPGLAAGHFFAPTVFTAVPATARLAKEEPFGPIATVEPFDALDEAITLANASPYGLAAYAFTANLDRAHRLADELQAGLVGINHFGVSQPELPFGGWKASGHGQEMGPEGLLAYTDLKTVVIGRAG